MDTGAGYSVIPRPVLEALGCQVHRTQRVILADGRTEEWPVAQVDEEFGLGIDPLNRRLVPVDLYLATCDSTTE